MSGNIMGMPNIPYSRIYTTEEFYWVDSPPITYSPGPLKFYVPVELFQLILENIDHRYSSYYVLLKKLRLVSRAWNYEADRFFFRTFGVAEGHFVDVARALLARPKRASYIRALRVDWAQKETVEPEHLHIIRRAFMIMPNLETLRERYSSGNILLKADDAYILKNVPFRLRSWQTAFRWCPQLEEILLEQTYIRKFECLADVACGRSPPEQRLAKRGILPRCDILDVGPGILPTFHNIGDLPAVRHLTFRLDALYPEQELMAAPGVRAIGAQLTSLVVCRISMPTCEFTPMPDLIREIIGTVPSLLLFGVMDGQILTPRDNAQIRTMVCNHLPRLKTFLWAQNVQGWGEVEELDDEDMDGDDLESDDSDDEEENGERLNSHEKFGRYACKYFANHPALEYVTGYFHQMYDTRSPIAQTRYSSQSLYKRVWHEKQPGGYTVQDIDPARLITYDRCDVIDPRAPEDYMLRSHINPNRFVMPNPALSVLDSHDSDSD